ncbi:hypothetical protein RM572_17735 [Streptomyces sp. DSM 42041]|uniref:Uncharacterized protein n=1 Tax=Streptomyces hazeniae TaxID=3075538 RepID=A0ABU2NY91_9ACTN|nr:hypothetical protein [Streptomyces sp. DSM 42041]MDT0380598.1 hypothetical protein [Streptomyces sp. DSM 42041]
MTTPVYTRTEKAQRARLLLKGAKNCSGDVSRIEAQIERIDQAAADRGRREHEAHARRLNEAKDTLAAARVAERTATSREERQRAKGERREAEKRLRVVERAAR